ncbi:MAG: ADP-ribosylglycohydrolase family protein [Methanomassiliicoccales archaeon]
MTRFSGCMLGCAVGDSLGASFEGTLDPRVEEMPFGGRWTDDTHMMLGIAESLVERGGMDEEHMMRRFMENYREEPWRGYGPGPPTIFRMVREGVPWGQAAGRLFHGEGSFGNGSAMRVAPIGLLYHRYPERLREMAHRSSALTHTHPLGKEGAALQAYAVSLALRADEVDPKEFLEEVERFARADVYREKMRTARDLLEAPRREVIRSLGHSVEAFRSVPTAIYSFARNPSDFSQAVTYAISLGGDTDTIGAMCGSIAGAHHGEEGIPERWSQVERADHIRELSAVLERLAGEPL